MTFTGRAEVAMACAPAWFAGVAVAALAATLLGTAKAGGFDAEAWQVAMTLFLYGMLMTLPALLVCGFVAFAFAPWVAARPVLFGAMSGLATPMAFLLVTWDVRDSLFILLLAAPGVVAATFVFRQILRARTSGQRRQF